MAGAADVALQEDGIVAEGGAGLEPRLFQQAREIGGPLDHAHAAPATAERSLDDQREADPARDLRGLRRARHRPLRARHHGDAGADSQLSGGCFIAQKFQQFGARSDESDACGGAGARQPGFSERNP